MNILHLNTHLNVGGISSYLETLGKALTKKGHRVSVLSAGGTKVPALERGGIRCFSFPIRTKSELHPKLLLALPGIVALVRREKFEILHAHTRVTEVLAAWVSRATGIPFVSTAHGFYKARWGRRIFPCWGRRVIAVSAFVAEDLERTHRVPPSKVTVVDNAVNVEDFDQKSRVWDSRKVRSENGIPENAFVIGCISRLVRDKGQEYLVEAAGRLTKEIPDIFLVLVGDGREKKRLEVLIGKLGLRARVRLLTGIEDTTAVLSAVDLFVHPATWREGFGLAVAEALLAKKPVILTKIPVLDTLFQDGVNAVLVAPKDPDALARAVLAIHQDPQKAKVMAANGRQMVSTLYRAERQADEIERVYQEVLSEWKKKKNSKI